MINNKVSQPYYYELAIGKRPEYELFDVKADPYNIDNLAENPSYRDVLDELKSQLFQYLELRQDPRITGNQDLWQFSPAFILWNGEMGSGVNYAPNAQGQNIPTARMKRMLIEYYHKNEYDPAFVSQVMERLEQNLDSF